jgi:hypothetical protein
MPNIIYPDSGNRLEDASVLRNAVYFSTRERANSIELISQQLQQTDKSALIFFTVKAFEEFMISTEDLMGWLFALKEWQPGTAEFSLLILLNKIQIGKSGYEEKRAVSLLSSLDGEGFRKLCHIPDKNELINSGMTIVQAEKIINSMSRKLEGWLILSKVREEQNRGRVRMFNKLKHHMLAFPTEERNKNEIWVPTSIRLDKANNRVGIAQGWLEVSDNMFKKLVGNAITAQAVLHNTLAIILVTRYGEKYVVPDWVKKVYQTYYADSDK